MAWPEDRRPSDALTGQFVPEIWSAKVLDYVKSELVCANVVNASYKADLKRGDKVNIPVLSGLTANMVVVTSDGVITNLNTSIGTTAVSITIDKWYECPIQIDDSVNLQTMVGDMAEICARNSAYEVAKTLDTDVNTLFASLTSTWAGADGQTFSDDILIALMEGLDKANIKRENRALVGDPSMLADCYKIDKFMHMDYTNDPLGKQGGFKGRIAAYNLPFYVTTNLKTATTGKYGALLHQDAIGLVIQDGPRVRKWREERRHSDIINVDMTWGADVLRATFGAYFYTRSAT